MKKLCILGVNGFIGHHLSKRILGDTGWEVFGMDMGSDRIGDLMDNRRFHFFEGDITINREVFYFTVPAIIGLFFWLLPTPALACGALATFFALSLHYEFCHFMAHTNWCPPLDYYRRRQRMHRLHHHRDEKLWWGVSMGLGDRIMGTAPDFRTVERSTTVRDVHGLLRQRGERAS